MNGERTTIARLALQRNPTSMSFHQVARDAQAQTHALLKTSSLIAAIKRLKYLPLFIQGDARAIIGDTDQSFTPVNFSSNEYLTPEWVCNGITNRFSTAEGGARIS
jgi:hypothetical protein